jgi:nitrogen fixation/metabolism regulation signal transduction histidine kinase
MPKSKDMASNRFHISLILHCILLFVALFLAFFFYYTRQQPSTAAGMIVLSMIVLFRLIYLVNRTNRILANFLVYMQERDPSLSYTVKYTDRNFRGLNESLERLIRDLKESRLDLEVQAHYLEAILDNVSTGIITLDESGQIRTMNRAARGFLGKENLDQLLEEKPKHLSIQRSVIKLKTETLQIIALNDISSQMEEQEIRSWKKLIRVINHEIMNSMTPIITLAGAIQRKLGKSLSVEQAGQLSEEVLRETLRSTAIIEERSNGLVSFIERYKKLTGLPPVKPERFPAAVLIEKVEQLFREELKQQSIRLILPSECKLELVADRQMLEQVMINLVKNAVDAVGHMPDPEIELSCHREANQQICLSVWDNGPGIAPDKLDQVFVPFFTTKDKGSGIGLSLCKQIIQLHEGKIELVSTPGKGTRVSIRL